LYRERIHCAEHTLKLISYLLYTPTGELFEYAPTKEGDLAPIIPDSLGDVFEKALCPLVRQKQEEDRKKSEAKAKTAAAEKAAAEARAKLKTVEETIKPPLPASSDAPAPIQPLP